jgi:hypothetical protein
MSNAFKTGASGTPAQYTGIFMSDSAYGQAIPYVYGKTRISGRCIFTNNLTGYQSGGKKGGKSQSLSFFDIDGDFICGYGPMEALTQSCWVSGTWYYQTYGSQTFNLTGTNAVWNLTVSNQPATLYTIMGVAVADSTTPSFTDYVAPGITRSFTATGNGWIPLYNSEFVAPNSGNVSRAGIPYATYNATVGSTSVTVTFPAPVTNPTIIVYYNYATSGGGSTQTLAQVTADRNAVHPSSGIVFERELGSGPEGAGGWPEFSGFGGTQLPIGTNQQFNQYRPEVKALFGLGNQSNSINISVGGTHYDYVPVVTSGDCNPADIILDLITSGNHIDVAGTSSFLQVTWNHGLGFTSFYPNILAVNAEYYARFGGILKDESNLWSNTYAGSGTNQGLNAIRNYCLAYGLFISGTLESQSAASQVLDDLCKVANCAPCWDGAALDFIPYCETSNYANGGNYVAPTASGPSFNFVISDFIVEKDTPPVTVKHQRAQDNINSLIVQYQDATLQYSNNQVICTDTQDIFRQGAMPGSPLWLPMIQDGIIATKVGYGMLHREIIVKRDTYQFKLSPAWGPILTLMDFVALPWEAFVPDPTIGSSSLNLNNLPVPVRITKITENADLSLDIEAEGFYYGASAPVPPTQAGNPTSGGGTGGNGGIPPDNVNPPIIFEAIPAIAPFPELWFCLSGPPVNGGCDIWMSQDGGSTYSQIGTLAGNQTMGLTYSSDYPPHADPDNTDTLNVDLTESDTALSSFGSTQQNQYQSLCLLSPGGTVTLPNGTVLTIPYELVAYGTATLSTAHKYALAPPIRRGVYNTPIADHPIGSNFSFILDGNIFKWILPANLVGVTLFFKFAAFNNQGAQTQQLGGLTVYSFTPSGQVGFNQQTYTISPSPCLYQGQSGGWPGIDSNSSTWTDSTRVYWPQITAVWSDGISATYQANDAGIVVFSNSGGGQTAYCGCYDPTRQGDPPNGPYFADLSPTTHYDLGGYTQFGTLVSQPYSGGGGSGGGTPGPANDMYCYVPGVYTASQELLAVTPCRQVEIPVGLMGTTASCDDAPTGNIAVTLKKNGVSIGTINFAAASTTPTYTFTAAVTLNGTTDEITWTAPATADATFAGFRCAIKASRSN